MFYDGSERGKHYNVLLESVVKKCGMVFGILQEQDKFSYVYCTNSL